MQAIAALKVWYGDHCLHGSDCEHFGLQLEREKNRRCERTWVAAN